MGVASRAGSRVVHRPLDGGPHAFGLTTDRTPPPCSVPCPTPCFRASVALVEAVFLHADVQLMTGQPERLCRFRLVETCRAERLLDHGPLHLFEIARRRWL